MSVPVICLWSARAGLGAASVPPSLCSFRELLCSDYEGNRCPMPEGVEGAAWLTSECSLTPFSVCTYSYFSLLITK